MFVGYMRVSTDAQNLDLQKTALEQAGCTKIYDDIISGSRPDRRGLDMALEVLREGDTLVVWKLDRLGRSLKQLIALIESFGECGIHFKSLTDSIDTQTTAGRFFFHVMASLAQMERDLIRERTQAGLIAARAKGRIGGRKRLMTVSKIEMARKLIADGIPAKEIAATFGVSVSTFYRHLANLEKTKCVFER